VQSEITSSNLEPLIAKLEYRVKLNQADRDAIMALPFHTKVMRAHQYVVRERELATHSCLMLSGYSVRSKIVGTGQRQILAIHMKGEMVDLQNSLLKVADHSVEMLTAGKVALIPREEIVELTKQRPTVALAMWIDTLVDASIFREWIANIGRRNARTRVAHLLCEFALRLKVAGLGNENHYELPMTQEQIGDATGLTAVHVNRTIKALEQEGLIHRISSRSIEIGDWRRLVSAGDFSANYLHMPGDEPALQ
jgi:CRP-like cAMP-binding protein